MKIVIKEELMNGVVINYIVHRVITDLESRGVQYARLSHKHTQI